MRVLSFDPGTVSTGWALRENNNIIECGKIKCPSGWKQSKRLGFLMKEVMGLILRVNPHQVKVEQQHVGKNAKTSLITARAMGTIISVAGAVGLPCIARQPSEIKKSVTGKGNASKEEVALKLLEIYKDNEVIQSIGPFIDSGVNKTDDMYDAVAILYDDIVSSNAGEEL